MLEGKLEVLRALRSFEVRPPINFAVVVLKAQVFLNAHLIGRATSVGKVMRTLKFEFMF